MGTTAPLKMASKAHRQSKNPLSGVDIPLVLIVLSLATFGLIVLYSASMPIAIRYDYHPIEDVFDQLRWVLLGLFFAGVIAIIDYRKWQKWIMLLLIGTIGMLFLVLIIGDPRYGATRTFFNGRVQPSEITKVVVILYLAFWLKSKGEYLKKITLWVVPIGAVLGIISVFLWLEPDYSALITVVAISGILLFLAHIDWWQALLITIIGLFLFFLVINFSSTGEKRWNDFQNGLREPSTAISQVQRSFESIVDGGIFGVGIGQGTVKFTGLEVGQTDTIFTVVAEEMGLVGSFFVLLLFLGLLWRGVKIALNSQDLTGQLIAAGITFWILVEAFINIASLINLAPVGGNTLPFFSKGGSSIVSILIGIGFLLSVSRVNHQANTLERSPFNAVVDMRWRDRGRSVSRSRRSASTRR